MCHVQIFSKRRPNRRQAGPHIVRGQGAMCAKPRVPTRHIHLAGGVVVPHLAPLPSNRPQQKTAHRDSAIVDVLIACDLTSFTASSHAKENARSGARGPSIPRQCNGKHPSGKATPLLSVATCDYPGISQTGTNPSQCAFTRLLRSADLLPDRRMPAPSTMPPPDRSR